MKNLEELKEKNPAFTKFDVKMEDLLLRNSPILRIKTGIIYLIINMINGKVYVGQTLRTFRKRYRLKWWCTTSNEHLINAVKKYGENNFRIVIIEENKNQADLDILETHYILSFQSYKDEYGYNKTLGGEVNRQSPEVKEKKDIEKFNLIIQKSKELYGENKFQYLEAKISDKSKIHLICNICGYDFWQDVHFHLHKNRECRKCSIKQQAINKTFTFNEFIQKARQKHGDEYEYFSEGYVNLKTRLPIKHKICGQISNILPYGHLIQGCNYCRRKKFSKRQSKTVDVTTPSNQKLSFDSIKKAQLFINKEMNIMYNHALRNQHILQGSQFNYHGYIINISEQRGGTNCQILF